MYAGSPGGAVQDAGQPEGWMWRLRDHLSKELKPRHRGELSIWRGEGQTLRSICTLPV